MKSQYTFKGECGLPQERGAFWGKTRYIHSRKNVSHLQREMQSNISCFNLSIKVKRKGCQFCFSKHFFKNHFLYLKEFGSQKSLYKNLL